MGYVKNMKMTKISVEQHIKKLSKKMKKLECQYEKASERGCFLRAQRLLKLAQSIEKKQKFLGNLLIGMTPKSAPLKEKLDA